MRKTGRDIARWDDSNWTEHVNWDSFVDKMPLAISYGKGLPTIKKTVYMLQWHQHVLEQIMQSAKHHFRTETDLTRSIMNIGIVMYYNIFIKNQGIRNDAAEFFYKVVRDCEQEFRNTDMAEAMKHTIRNTKIKCRQRLMTPEVAAKIYNDMLNAVPNEHRDSVLDIIKEDGGTTVVEIRPGVAPGKFIAMDEY